MNPAVQMKNVCAYYGTQQILFDIDLSVAQGSFFGLLGVNGAGKSTLLSLISTLLSPASGSIHIQGVDLLKQAVLAKKHLGVVPQEINLNGFESVRNVLFLQAGYFGYKQHQVAKRFEYLLQTLDLWDKRDARVMHLSGGMKRRLMIARALITNPKVLLLDEPTAGVDVNIRRDMWRFIQDINQDGTTVILTTHYLEEAESLCDQIAVIEQGRIIRQDSKDAILRSLDTQTFLCETTDSLPIPLPQTRCAATLEHKDKHELRLVLPSQTSLNDVLAELTLFGIRVVSIRPEKNRLETLVSLSA